MFSQRIAQPKDAVGPMLVARKPQARSLPSSHGANAASWAFGDVAVSKPGMSPQATQPKLVIGGADDALEHDADRAAEQVMSGGSQGHAKGALQTKRADSSSGAGGSEAPPAVHDAIASPGQALDPATRSFFEPRFGHDFSQVRVHADRRAADSAEAVQAQAYTVGRDIVFGAGEYAPHTASGRQLLAHELAHTVQQGGAGGGTVRRKLKVGAGRALNTKGFSTTKAGDVYTCSAIVKNSVWNEIFTALLASPRVFTIAGSTNAEVDANLEKHMQSRLGIVQFAAQKKYSFAAGSGVKMNPTYWAKGPGGWDTKPGVDRKKAVDDLNVHPKDYAIACLRASKLTMEGGGKSPLGRDTGVSDTDWIPGDWGYIKNTKFPAAGGTPGLEGENIIYTGKDKWWGHFDPGNTYKSLTEWFDQVKSWNGGADILKHRDRPTIGLS